MSEVICNNGHVMNPGDEACRRCKSKPMDSEDKGVPQEETLDTAPESAPESAPETVAPSSESATPADEAGSAPEASLDAEGAVEGPEVTE